MINPHELLQLIETHWERWLSVAPNGGTRFVAGRVVEQDRLVILFRWMQRPEVFGAIYDLTDYRSTFGTATADFLAGSIVSNDLAAPPGHGVMLDVDWADGLVPDSNLIRWVGAPAEITR
jgi:hypothetical protein